MSNAKRDDNRVPTLIAVSSVDGVTPVLVYADPTTHRVLIDGGGITSVSGTTNRITSTGGTTPVIDISADYDATLSSTYQDTQANILALTPTKGLLAWATDLNQFMVADGSNWWIDSAYLAKDLSAPDMGYVQGSNRSGYGQNYVSDKTLANSRLGENGNTDAGGVRYNPLGLLGTLPAIQAYYNGAWNNLVGAINLQEVSGVLQQDPPVGYTYNIQVFSGNSTALGLNGLPIVQGYLTSMGAYPVTAQIDGGTF